MNLWYRFILVKKVAIEYQMGVTDIQFYPPEQCLLQPNRA